MSRNPWVVAGWIVVAILVLWLVFGFLPDLFAGGGGAEVDD